VPGVAGTWKDLTDNVNSMAANLTAQVRNIAEVTTAVANGDLSKKITVDASGEILRAQGDHQHDGRSAQLLRRRSDPRGARSRHRRQARRPGPGPGVAGTWKDLTDNVNFMATNLTGQVRNIAEVTTAVANGDLSKKITVDVRGEILELKETINTMVDQLNAFAGEVTRVAREVGTEGKLGGQAAGAGRRRHLEGPDRQREPAGGKPHDPGAQHRRGHDRRRHGDLSKKITVDVRGEILELKDTINTMVDQLNGFAGEVTRVAREVGTEGKLGGQAQVPGVAGTGRTSPTT
jgi:HAMP domain-containing protein